MKDVEGDNKDPPADLELCLEVEIEVSLGTLRKQAFTLVVIKVILFSLPPPPWKRVGLLILVN